MEHVEFSIGDKGLPDIMKALGNRKRLAALMLLEKNPMCISDLARALKITQSAVSQHIAILYRAGLVTLELSKKERYSAKLVSPRYGEIRVRLFPASQPPGLHVVKCEMPIGAFVDASVQPPCGMYDAAGRIQIVDHEQVFSHPDRLRAQKLWIGQGYLEYNFPREFPQGTKVEEIIFFAEISSEATLPIGHNECPSDITFWINNVEIGTWTCPGFFTGQRGRYTPSWVDIMDNQYGLMKTWYITAQGSRIDGLKLSDVTPEDLHLFKHKHILVRLGHKPDAVNKNGINLFGRHFGNYPQDLVLQVKYRNHHNK